MNVTTLYEAIGYADPKYLAHCEQRPERGTLAKRRIVRSALLAALLLIAFSATAAAAIAILHPRIQSEPDASGSLSLFFSENPAADDAPDWNETCYLVAVDPGRYSVIDAEWNSGLMTAINWSNDSGAQIGFSQRPLKTILARYDFFNIDIDPEELEEDELVLDDTAYYTVVYKSDYGNAAWYFCLDEKCHYLFEFFFNEGIPEEERHAVMKSLRPVSGKDLLDTFGMDKQQVWLPVITADGMEPYSHNLYVRSSEIAVFYTWHDRMGRVVSYSQNQSLLSEPNPVRSGETRQVDGRNVVIQTMRYSMTETETWFFLAPDGVTELELAFKSKLGGTIFTEEEKFSVFRSIQEAEHFPDDLMKGRDGE